MANEPEFSQSPTCLPANFRTLSLDERRRVLASVYEIDETTMQYSSGSAAGKNTILQWADTMVESAIGTVPIPLGIAAGFVIDGTVRDIPIATEEPSVIAAASHGAKVTARGGGITTAIDEPIMTTQLFVEPSDPAKTAALCENHRAPAAPATDTPALNQLSKEIRQELAGRLSRMNERGGGFRHCDALYLPQSGLLRLQLHIDVRDAMGANVLNTVGEALTPLVERHSGGRVLMSILTNDASQRLARADFCLPIDQLRRRGVENRTLAKRIALASQVAQEDPQRAVTHNKGIMNGVTGLALATGNDTRGLEAAIHRYAAGSGEYRGLSQYWIEQDSLRGRICLPMPLGSLGGSVGFQPATAMALRILRVDSAAELGRTAAALGLAQNLSAVSALVSEGIQRGHMRLHEQRRRPS